LESRDIFNFNILQTRVVDPDSVTLGIWIRIRIGNPDPDPGAKNEEIQLKNALFSVFFLNFTTEKV
jgi:hypothetical protein